MVKPRPILSEVQRRAPEHADEYAAAEALLRLRINEWLKDGDR